MPADRALLQQVAQAIYPNATEVAHLGSGGFASTFRIGNEGDVFALKILDPSVTGEDRLDFELAALQRVSDSGVVQFLADGSQAYGGVIYRWIQMEFIDGRTLAELFDAGEVLTHLESIRLVRDMVSAASAIWAERTAHRDLSPRNIMLRPDGKPVIVDLGLARHVEDETTILPTPGTPGWMSPEQVGGTPRHGDWRSDQFVLGALGYRLLTNLRPFWAVDVMTRWAMPATHDPRPIRGVDPDVPSAAADVIERMIEKAPHRRYLQPSALLADLDRAIVALESETPAPDRSLSFVVNISALKSFAENGFITVLSPGSVVIDARMNQQRTAQFVAEARGASALSVLDPVTHFARSPLSARPGGFTSLPYGGGPALTGFSDDTERTVWCNRVLAHSVSESPDVVITPYFYAGEGEGSWITESLACARKFEEITSQVAETDQPELWTGVALHSSWLANSHARDTLLTAITGQPMDALYLLVATPQPSFGPIGDLDILRGFRDLLNVSEEAGVPVAVGRRSTSGLLLLSLGAQGWATGVSANLMNMIAHPEQAPGRAGQPVARVYVPALLNLISIDTYVLMRASGYGGAVELDTDEFAELIRQNPDLEELTTEQAILLHCHNLKAQKAQVVALAARPSGQRIALMQEWVATAIANYASLPAGRQPSDSGNFLAAWRDVLV